MVGIKDCELKQLNLKSQPRQHMGKKMTILNFKQDIKYM